VELRRCQGEQCDKHELAKLGAEAHQGIGHFGRSWEPKRLLDDIALDGTQLSWLRRKSPRMNYQA
jgi:hypothetical protein